MLYGGHMKVMSDRCELLEGYRVLDLTDSQGYLCGKIMGDLGADVIKIEPPQGDAGRSVGPFYRDIPHPEKSLFWFAYNHNKRGITLNIETADGRQMLERLVASADFLIESFPPGYLDSLGLGYSVLKEANERLIFVSITPFGQTGPYSSYKASDIVSMAMSGEMYLCGDPDRPPLRISFPQACWHACADAAVGALVAYYHREQTGEGQQVDISIHHSAAMTAVSPPAFWHLRQQILRREGGYQVGITSATKLKLIWKCKDGFIAFRLLGGATGAKTNRIMMEWMSSEGITDDFLKSADMEHLDLEKTSQETLDRMCEPFARFFLQHTKKELFEGSIKKGIMLYLVSTPADLLESEQLKARNFWVQVEHPELDDVITYPGAFIKASATPISLYRRAPLIGEHNEEIYCGELGFSREQLVEFRQANII